MRQLNFDIEIRHPLYFSLGCAQYYDKKYYIFQVCDIYSLLKNAAGVTFSI